METCNLKEVNGDEAAVISPLSIRGTSNESRDEAAPTVEIPEFEVRCHEDEAAVADSEY